MTGLLILLAGAFGAQNADVHIGSHYTNALSGLAVYRSAKESVLLDIGWMGADGKFHENYDDLSAAMVRFGEAAPDDSYHRITWGVGPATVTYEWGLTGKNAAVGRISSDGNARIRLRLGPAWPGSNPKPVSIPGKIVEQAGNLRVSMDVAGDGAPADLPPDNWSEQYFLNAATSVSFSIGTGSIPKASTAETTLDKARQKYKVARLWAEGDWGDFLSPIENQLGNSKVYSIDTGKLAHIVSRRWCLPDGQVLFCWDSFFNGLLSSLEDPVMAKNTVRAVLAGETPDGFVPNYSGRGWGSSNDRSQPCVGSYCVWKINQRQPDKQFLRDAYPKLLRWHKWWFSKNAKGKGHRDGNGDGLLEWGTETGDLQNAKFESGLDDSPMFDDCIMSGPTMTSDSTDLSALWAMDADYLSRIADAIGLRKDAEELRAEKDAMARRMDDKLWNPAMNAYCYRYWTPRQPLEEVDLKQALAYDGMGGLHAEYFHGRDLKGEATMRQDDSVDFTWKGGPLPGFGPNDFSIRWTGGFTAAKGGPYTFKLISDDGCRMWVDDKKVIDAWSVHSATAYYSEPLVFAAGSKHKIRVEYFQAAGGAEVHLSARRTLTDKPGQVFSTRLSPLNFYPLIANAPSNERARKTLDLFFEPSKFGGPTTVCPTVSRDDPAYPAQGYWRGTIWGPTSYLTFQGIRKYATDQENIDYAEKSVRLFMKNWIKEGTCRENFNSVGGRETSDPHYTWGALMCLIGLEDLCDSTAEGHVRLNGDSGRHIKVHNLRIGGHLYDLTIEPKSATLREHGRTVADVRGKVAVVRI